MHDGMTALQIPGKSPRSRALTTARDLTQWVPVEGPGVPYALQQQSVEVLRAPTDKALLGLRNSYIRQAVSARETNRFRLRGVFWALRALRTCVQEDPSDKECREHAATLESMLAEVWRVPQPLIDTPDIVSVERFVRTRFALTPNTVIHAIAQARREDLRGRP